ncbi:hypothetical protein DFP72DRAFT_857269 [Ephemerocybe angulata]|uniref:Uncharacterized protein n=1 Tax=Ephemerocybe angulata TaxID=980116 RepID=A0A8H6HCM6_9AGAR|nr:hypothetical protein DFP72DRAFT_857269 [Tulosesus angulatus]
MLRNADQSSETEVRRGMGHVPRHVEIPKASNESDESDKSDESYESDESEESGERRVLVVEGGAAARVMWLDVRSLATTGSSHGRRELPRVIALFGAVDGRSQGEAASASLCSRHGGHSMLLGESYASPSVELEKGGRGDDGFGMQAPPRPWRYCRNEGAKAKVRRVPSKLALGGFEMRKKRLKGRVPVKASDGEQLEVADAPLAMYSYQFGAPPE